MSAQDETLRMAAEVVDKWSGPMREMQRALLRMQDQLKTGHKQGVNEAKKHGEAVLSLNQTFSKLDGMLKTSFTPTMAAMGVTVLTVAGAVETLKDTVLGFGATTRQLSFLSRETRLSINELRTWDALARRIGTTPDVMNQGVRAFAQHMHDMRNGVRSEIDAWGNISNPFLRGFVQDISRLPIGEALSKAVGELSHIPDQQEKRTYLRMLGLPTNLADVPVADLRRMMAEIQKNIGTLGPDAEKSALRFETAINRLQDSIDRLKIDVGGGLAPAFTEMTDAIDRFVNANRQELVEALKGVAQWIEQVDWKSVATGVASVAKSVGELAHRLGDVKAVANELGGMWLGRVLFGVPGMVGGALWNAPHPKVLDQTPGEALKNSWDWFKNAPTSPSHPSGGMTAPWIVPPGLVHKESFTPGRGGLFQPASFVTGVGSDPVSIIAKGTKTGVLDALREWQAYMSGDNAGSGLQSGGGFRMASYEQGGGGLGTRFGGGGLGGGLSGGGSRGAGGGGPSASGGPADLPQGGSDNAYVAQRRAAFAKELSDPNKRLQFAAMLLSEGTPLPTAESAMNRSLYSHRSLMQMLRSGFYGPINHGRLPAFMAQLRRNPKLMARMNAAIDRALGGSDTIHGFTDQGMPTDPNGPARPNYWGGPWIKRGGNIFNDWGGGPGGHRGAERWRRQFEANAAGALHEHYTTGAIMETLRGTLNHHVRGNAHVHVRVDGLPRGARSSVKSDGIFKSVTLSRGRTMEPADTE